MSTADAPPAKKAKKDLKPYVNRDFPLTPEVDIWIRCRSNRTYIELYGTSKLYLQAASSVFRDTLAIANAAETYKSIPIIDLAETRIHVKTFLLHVDPSKANLPDGKLRLLDLDWTSDFVHAMARMAEKYDAPLVLRSILNAHLPFLHASGEDRVMIEPSAPLDALGLALVYGLPFHVRAALRTFEHRKLRRKGAQTRSRRMTDIELDSDSDSASDSDFDDNASEPDEKVKDEIIKGARDFTLSDMNEEILARLSTHHIREFSQVAGRVASRPRYSWRRAANSFRIEPDPPS